MLRSPEDAADASQEVFLTALNSLKPETPGARARSWLLTVARNRCIDLIRQRRRQTRAVDLVGVSSHPGPDLETTVADRDLIQGLFKQLPLRERQALWQSAVESRPLSDIATGLQLNYMATAQVLHRARLRASVIAGRVAVLLGLAEAGRVSLSRRALVAEMRLVAAVQRQTGATPWPLGARLLVAALLPILVATVQVAGALPGGSPAARHITARIPRLPLTAGGASKAATTNQAAPGATASAAQSDLGPAVGLPLGGQSPLRSLVQGVGSVTNQLAQPSPAVPGPGPVASVPSLPVVPLPSPIPAVPTLVPTPGPGSH
jgi:RNA polymerase sigma-70 factor (ECF subfamily)